MTTQTLQVSTETEHRAAENPAGASARNESITNYLLWTVQVLLALVFLFAGGMKLVLPIGEMTKQTALPGPFLRFIGIAEVAGALGLILPGALRVPRGLTALAAGGLVL